MNALEKLGYVKQSQDEDSFVQYIKIEGNFKMQITLDIENDLVGKEFQFKEREFWELDWLDKAELKAILELMEE